MILNCVCVHLQIVVKEYLNIN